MSRVFDCVPCFKGHEQQDEAPEKALIFSRESSEHSKEPAVSERSGNDHYDANSFHSFASQDFEQAMMKPDLLKSILQDMRHKLDLLNAMNMSPAGESARSKVAEGVQELQQLLQTEEEVQIDVSQRPGALAPALNTLVGFLWPRIDEYVENMIFNDIEPSLNESIPFLKGRIKFDREHVCLGKSHPKLGPIQVEFEESTGTIEVKMGFHLQSQMEIFFSVAGVSIGVTDLSFHGDLVIVLAPPKKNPPFFGGIQIFFPNPPDINVKFRGAARTLSLPGLRGSVRNAIDSAVSSICVLPNRVAIDMDEEDDVDNIELEYPEPLEIVRLTLFEGNDLQAADVNLFGARTSDPYVNARLGLHSWTSPHIPKTLNPVWNHGLGLTEDIMIHNHNQVLQLKVFDYDRCSSDDLIGVAKKITVEDLKEFGNGKVTLLLSGEASLPDANDAGSLQVGFETLNLTTRETQPKRPGPSSALLSLKVWYVADLPVMQDGCKVRVRLLAPNQSQIHDDQRAKEGYQHQHNSKSSASQLFRGAASAVNLTRTLSSKLTHQFSSKPKGGNHNDEMYCVLVKAVSGPGRPKEQHQLAEALQDITKTMASRNHGTKDISEILGVDEQVVENFLVEGERKSKAKEAADRKAKSNPEFKQVIHMLVPSLEGEMLEIATNDASDWLAPANRSMALTAYEPRKTIQFRVRAASDVCILLSPKTLADGKVDITSGQYYELVVGGNNNSQTLLRRRVGEIRRSESKMSCRYGDSVNGAHSRHGAPLREYEGKVLNEDELMDFWIVVNTDPSERTICFGKGPVPGHHRILSYIDDDLLIPEDFAVTSGKDVVAHWELPGADELVKTITIANDDGYTAPAGRSKEFGQFCPFQAAQLSVRAREEVRVNLLPSRRVDGDFRSADVIQSYEFIIGGDGSKCEIRRVRDGSTEVVAQGLCAEVLRGDDFVDLWCALNRDSGRVSCGIGQVVGQQEFASFEEMGQQMKPEDFAIGSKGDATWRYAGAASDDRIIELAIIDGKSGDKCIAYHNVRLESLRESAVNKIVSDFKMNKMSCQQDRHGEMNRSCSDSGHHDHSASHLDKKVPSLIGELRLKWLC